MNDLLICTEITLCYFDVHSFNLKGPTPKCTSIVCPTDQLCTTSPTGPRDCRNTVSTSYGDFSSRTRATDSVAKGSKKSSATHSLR